MFAALKEQFHRTGAALPFRRKEAQPAQRSARAARTAPTEGRFRRFIRETRSELRKVVWPTREQVRNLTAIVIAVSAAVGVVMGGVDFVFEKLFQALLGAR